MSCHTLPPLRVAFCDPVLSARTPTLAPGHLRANRLHCTFSPGYSARALADALRAYSVRQIIVTVPLCSTGPAFVLASLCVPAGVDLAVAVPVPCRRSAGRIPQFFMVSQTFEGTRGFKSIITFQPPQIYNWSRSC